MHLNLSETIDGGGIDDGPVQHFSLEDLFENNFEKENARVIHEPNFENSETFEESFVEEMPDPAKEMVEPESKDQNDKFFQQDSIPVEHSSFPREKHVHFEERPEIYPEAPLSEKQIFIGKRLKFVKPSTSSACRLSRWPRRVNRTFTASLACTRT